MKKITFLVAFFAISLTIHAQVVDTESFEDITTLESDGFTLLNVSEPTGTTADGWFQPSGTIFPAHSGGPTEFLAANFDASGDGTISLWLFLPELNLINGDMVSFFTRTQTGSLFPDRLEVRLNPSGTDTQPTNALDTGSYSSLLLSINENLMVGGYPEDWEQQEITISGLTGPTDARIAIRYFVTDAGPNGTNSNYIGIDTLVVTRILGVADQSFNNFNYFVNATGLNLQAGVVMNNVVLYNLLGQQVGSQQLNNTNEIVTLSGLQSGVYLATVTIDGVSKTIRFVKS